MMYIVPIRIQSKKSFFYMLVLDMNTKFTAHSLVTANSVATPIVHLYVSLCPTELQAFISARPKLNSSVSHATVVTNAHAVASFRS